MAQPSVAAKAARTVSAAKAARMMGVASRVATRALAFRFRMDALLGSTTFNMDVIFPDINTRHETLFRTG